MPIRTAGSTVQVNGTFLGYVKEVQLPQTQVDTIDVTTLGNTTRYKEYIPSWIDSGEMQLSVFWDVDVAQASLLSALKTGVLNNFVVTLPADLGITLSCAGFVTAASSTINIDDALSVDYTIKVTGEATYSDVASAQLSGLTVTGTGIAAISPSVISGNYAFAAVGLTATSYTIVATLAGLTNGKVYVNGIFTQAFTSGSNIILPFTAIGSRIVTLTYNEAGKSQRSYSITVVKTA